MNVILNFRVLRDCNCSSMNLMESMDQEQFTHVTHGVLETHLTNDPQPIDPLPSLIHLRLRSNNHSKLRRFNISTVGTDLTLSEVPS